MKHYILRSYKYNALGCGKIDDNFSAVVFAENIHQAFRCFGLKLSDILLDHGDTLFCLIGRHNNDVWCSVSSTCLSEDEAMAIHGSL